ncbi:SO_0444 family Cu/Zn efflux transporter [Leucothrix arctica]|uniref:Permease n=1 Tax=Leucothrix arctica TaxID=1481894 RepID=A0A317CA36_9GAMM|nr:SO_0444 family Cu/Zn efflux transporter [Leucothrix arctica]PWQ95227.1 permease [Leucothrix arctica]
MSIPDNWFISFFQNLLDLSLEAAPWLIVGLALGGLMKALIPTEFLQKHLSGSGFTSIGKATLLGAPLPLCSCGVIPAAIGLRQAGASKPATAAFLVSTPETGVDSITVTYALMGPFMAIVRPISALISAFLSGSLVAIFDPDEPVKKTANDHATATKTDSCCSTEPQAKTESCCATEAVKDVVTETSSCCDSEPAKAESSCCSNEVTPPVEPSFFNKAWSGINYAFTTLLDNIVFWLMIGMLFAAASKTFLPPEFLAQWGQGLPAMLVMIAAGIPMYICATASTPVAAGLLMAGVSPGVALVLLLTGPATNISTLGVISKELGKRTMWLYLLGVSVTAIIAGLVTDALVGIYKIDIQTQITAGHEMMPMWLEVGSLAILVAVVLRSKLWSSVSAKLNPQT